MSYLPGFLGEIADLVGRDAALAVAQAKGGREKVWFPRPSYLKPGHWLVEAVGAEAAAKIAEQFQGLRIDVPLGPFAGIRAEKQAALRRALQAGSGAAEAAALAGVHQRTARRHAANAAKRAGKSAAPGGVALGRR